MRYEQRIKALALQSRPKLPLACTVVHRAMLIPQLTPAELPSNRTSAAGRRRSMWPGPTAVKPAYGAHHPMHHQDENDDRRDGDRGRNEWVLTRKPHQTDSASIFSKAEADIAERLRGRCNGSSCRCLAAVRYQRDGTARHRRSDLRGG